MNWILLFLLVFVNGLAGLFVKLGSTRDTGSLIEKIFDKNYFLGVFFYFLSFILFALALKKLPLNVVHPIATGGTVALVAFLTYFILGESFTLIKISGIICVMIGIFLISWR